MQSPSLLNTVSDHELLQRLASLLRTSRHTEADLVAHIAEVDCRRLYTREASPSMWSYCTERLHFSGAEAYLRITAGRASRQHPVVLEMLADGRLHLTAVALLAPVLTPENRDVLLQRATHKSKREVQELLAELEPRPDAPAIIRKLPERAALREAASSGIREAAAGPRETARAGLPEAAAATGGNGPGTTRGNGPGMIGGTLTTMAQDASADPTRPPESCRESGAVPKPAPPPAPLLRLDEVVSGRSGRVSEPPVVIEPLSPARYRVQFTASAALREKLERLRTLMRPSIPDGDLAAVIDIAVSEKLQWIESRRFGLSHAPRKRIEDTDVSPRSRHVPAAVRRAVHERDGGRCRYVDERGQRCTESVDVELHHRHPFALGGDHSPAGLSLQCPAHNHYVAEVDYGRTAMARHRRAARGALSRGHSE